ncbi:MAG TPA: tyrosine--tRNA ligase [Terriglobia bacterium]|nr:tyrosine--tRNA ligase [Terriglobia bacterium]
MTIDEELAYLTKGAAEVVPEGELKEKLATSRRTGRPLRAYLGVDPTAPDIHLGHTVVLRKLKHFQDLGHTAVFLIGDFSAMIGDPTGQSETRPPLSRDQVEANAQTYLAQVYKILDREKTEVRYNSEWLGTMSSYDVVRLCGHYRLARMLEREDFRSRLDQNLPIAVHELLYPLLTAIDAVTLESDVEIGATEQKFNLLVHRDIQREYGLSSQVALTMPILVGIDGERKMSKSLGNYIGITERPAEMFGKMMRISDDLMWRYYELLTDLPTAEIAEMQNSVKAGAAHPMELKKALARRVVSDFHLTEAAAQAEKDFETQFQDRSVPEDVPTRILPATEPRKLFRLLTELGLFQSNAEAQRKIKEGAVQIAEFENAAALRWSRITDPTWVLDPVSQGDIVLRAGSRRLLRVIFENEDSR